MSRDLIRTNVTVEKEAKTFFDKHLIKLSPFIQQKMRELLPISLQQRLEKERSNYGKYKYS